jgi:hypothetical protein
MEGNSTPNACRIRARLRARAFPHDTQCAVPVAVTAGLRGNGGATHRLPAAPWTRRKNIRPEIYMLGKAFPAGPVAYAMAIRSKPIFLKI